MVGVPESDIWNTFMILAFFDESLFDVPSVY